MLPPTPAPTAEAGGAQGEGVTIAHKGGGCTVAAAAAPVWCVRASLDDVVVRPPEATFEYVPLWSWIREPGVTCAPISPTPVDSGEGVLGVAEADTKDEAYAAAIRASASGEKVTIIFAFAIEPLPVRAK